MSTLGPGFGTVLLIVIICRLLVGQLSLMNRELLEGRETEPSSVLILGSLRELPEWSPGLGSIINVC